MRQKLLETNAKMTKEERSTKYGYMKGKVSPNKGRTDLIPLKSREAIRSFNLGKKHSEDTKQKMRGRTPWNKGKSGILNERNKA